MTFAKALECVQGPFSRALKTPNFFGVKAALPGASIQLETVYQEAIDMNIWIGKQSALTRLTSRAIFVDSYIIKTKQFHWASACFRIAVPAVVIFPALSDFCRVGDPLV